VSIVKSDVETLSPTRVKLTVEVPFDELKPSLDAAYKKIAAQVTIPGFRKGKVPARVIDQRVGRGVVLEEAVNEALPRAYDEAIRSSGVMPVGQPQVEVTEIADDGPLTFTAEVDVRPEFDLPEYSGLRVEVADAEPSDADVDEQLDALRTRFASLTTVERPAADGDVLLVDISGATESGDVVEDLSGAALSYELGTDGMLPGFDEAVRGASAGDTRAVAFTPEGGEYADVPLVATVDIKAVRERALPEADDDFAQLASEFDTLAELREDIRTRFSRVKRLEQGAEARAKTLDALLELVDIPLPETVIQAEVDEHFADGHASHGDGSTDEEHRAEVTEQARRQLKSQFVLDRLAEAEEITVGETELSAWLVQNAPRYGMSPDAFAQALVEAGQVQMAVQDVRRSKALALVMEQAEVVDASGRPVDLKALEAELVRPPVAPDLEAELEAEVEPALEPRD
jgi:trigger factor